MRLSTGAIGRNFVQEKGLDVEYLRSSMSTMGSGEFQGQFELGLHGISSWHETRTNSGPSYKQAVSTQRLLRSEKGLLDSAQHAKAAY